MKKRTKLVVYLLVMCLLVSIMPNSFAAAKRIKLSNKSVTLYISQTKTIKLKGTTKKPKWSSSKKSVATVSKNGKIKAMKKGSAVITAKLGKKKYKCKVKVKARPNPSIPPKVEVPQDGNTTVTPTEAPISRPTAVPTSNPTAVPTSNPTAVPPTNPPTAPAVDPKVEANYKKLADYIVENGAYDADNGGYYISGVADEEFYTSCDYNSDGSYKFTVMLMLEDAYNMVTVTITPPDYTKGAVANVFALSSDASESIYANGEVILSTLSKTNHSITYTDTDAQAEDAESLYKLGESMLAFGLQSWNDMIVNTGLGLSLKDLGFTSYDEGDVTTSTVADNYKKLADYIVENGTYDAESECYYISDYTDSFSTMCRYNLDGSYEFYGLLTVDGGGGDLLRLTITPPDYTKGEVANILITSLDDLSSSFYVSGEVALSTLTGEKNNITYTDTNAPTDEIKETLSNLGDQMLDAGLLSWDNMLKNTDLGLSLKDLGFTSYEPPVLS